MACSHSSGHSLDVTNSGKPSRASLGHPLSLISQPPYLFPSLPSQQSPSCLCWLHLCIACSIHFLLVEDTACPEHYDSLSPQQIVVEWINKSLKEGSSTQGLPCISAALHSVISFKTLNFLHGRNLHHGNQQVPQTHAWFIVLLTVRLK